MLMMYLIYLYTPKSHIVSYNNILQEDNSEVMALNTLTLSCFRCCPKFFK